jgi:4-hydroxy-tetrahydrodipicolinate reductase
MKILILGKGKTGSLVADVARERKHHIHIAGAKENTNCASLTPDALREIDAVIDFTAPHCVMANIEACVNAGKNLVVGTTGWYSEIPRVRALVESKASGFVYAANFSVGVNLFFEIARTAATAIQHDYSGQIFERHHVHKKDAPSGTAIAIQQVIQQTAGLKEGPEITSFREGEVVGFHEVIFDSGADRIYLSHDAKSRRGFAEGAVRAAEWLLGKKGFYDFKDIWREL